MTANTPQDPHPVGAPEDDPKRTEIEKLKKFSLLALVILLAVAPILFWSELSSPPRPRAQAAGQYRLTPSDADPVVVDLADVKDGWADPGSLAFTHDGAAHLPRRGLRVWASRHVGASMRVVETPNGGHRAVLEEPHQLRAVFPLEFGDKEQTPWDPQGTVKDDEPVELSLPSCQDYWDMSTLIPAEPCPADLRATVPYLGPTLPRYAMTLPVLEMQPGAVGWTPPDALAVAPNGCLVIDLFRPLAKQPGPGMVKVTALDAVRGWRADGPGEAFEHLSEPVKGRPHFYANALTAQGSYPRCPPY